MENLTNVIQVSCSESENYFTVIALCDDGSVWTKSTDTYEELENIHWMRINKGQNKN